MPVEDELPTKAVSFQELQKYTWGGGGGHCTGEVEKKAMSFQVWQHRFVL